ncbi:carboxymethylenebutenolidase [Bradyrhizobium lablabi]|uniref:Carboxymethylenebutenolidase n=1 Tax=Bradyrhizobium lablabi TaxID=722472 RepID=A0A1M7CXH0_9BRAD|nr:dienelactone hydrolase family protein [Bradyrhizobium lablabi]SHL71924.1 carboxymethylenebutenolidase [Bradyrhizobium lablabi]
MHRIDRRTVLAGLGLLALRHPARAGTPERLGVDTDDGRVVLTRYAADRTGARPSVLLLHGTNGFDLKPSAYERYAHALAAKGIDAYWVRYLSEADVSSFKTTRERREAYETRRFDDWAKKVSSVVTTILARPDCSGRIGLLGFSLGGYVAANTAARDERITALAVMYGGLPDAVVPEVKHLPPLIELHGEADRNVPPAKGEELVKLGKAIGVDAEFVGYPGKTHGFDFSDNDPMTADALGRVVGFFEARLLTATPTPASDSPRTPPAAQP